MEFSFEIILFLFSVALVAGFIDTLAGGGGLITIPSLLLSGIPPILALGTNKLQGAVGTATATYALTKSKKIDWSKIKYLFCYALLGAMFGTISVQFADPSALSFVVPFVLFFIAVYFLVSPFIPIKAESPKMSEKIYSRLVIPVIGFYDGMFGPGTGSFFALAGVALRGKELVQATVLAKPLNLATNFASLCVFLFADQVLWTIGCVMMLGQFIGARLGASMLFKMNKNLLRYLVVIMCVGMLIKYVMTEFPALLNSL